MIILFLITEITIHDETIMMEHIIIHINYINVYITY